MIDGIDIGLTDVQKVMAISCWFVFACQQSCSFVEKNLVIVFFFGVIVLYLLLVSKILST